MGLASHFGPVKLIPQASISGAGGLGGLFTDANGNSIIGKPTGGLINGAEKITVWVNVTAISGTLGVFGETSPDGQNLTWGTILGGNSGITSPGLYTFSYNGSPVSMIGFRWTLGTSTDTATVEGIFFEGSLA